MLLKEDFLSLKQTTDAQGLNKVKDLSDISHIQGKWRSWRNIDYKDDNPITIEVEALRSLLKQRMILVTEQKDQLRWGNNKEGNFNIKEAKCLLLDPEPQAQNNTWQKLWKYKGWMKIKLFMWLVNHRKILTWDNLKKRGMLGPSRCHLCETQEETIEHLLNSCIFTDMIWDLFNNIFKQSDRDK